MKKEDTTKRNITSLRSLRQKLVRKKEIRLSQVTKTVRNKLTSKHPIKGSLQVKLPLSVNEAHRIRDNIDVMALRNSEPP